MSWQNLKQNILEEFAEFAIIENLRVERRLFQEYARRQLRSDCKKEALAKDPLLRAKAARAVSKYRSTINGADRAKIARQEYKKRRWAADPEFRAKSVARVKEYRERKRNEARLGMHPLSSNPRKT